MIESPHLLPLLLVVFLPLVLHLLDRRRARVVAWPAMRFLLLGSRARLRRLQLREALLIIVRSLAVLAAVVAALQPVSLRPLPLESRTAGRRGVLAIADNSYSMAYREDAGAPASLEKARSAALELLDQLTAADEVLLLTAGGEVEAQGTDAARRAVAGLGLSGAAFRLLPLLDRAAEIMAGLTSPTREIYIFTDLQASMLPAREPSSWKFVEARLRASSLRGGVPKIRIVDCGSPRPVNHFIADLACGPLAATTDEVVTFTATLEMTGEDGASAREGKAPAEHLPGAASSGASPSGAQTLLRMFAGDDEIESINTLLEPRPRQVEIQHGFSQAGALKLSARLPADGLEEDDARYLALEVLDSIPVLVAGDPDGGDSRGTARFVLLALYPEVEGLAPPRVIFRPSFTTSLDSADFSAYRAVILCDLPRLEAGAAARLESYIAAGGGLLVFAGGRMNLPLWTESLFRRGKGILPARLAERAFAPAGGMFGPRDVEVSHPALSLFADPEEGDLSRVRIRAFTRARDWPEDVKPLAWIDPDSPWILEKRSGRGKVVLVTTSAALDDSDLPRLSLFLPLVQRLGRYLSGEDASSQAVLLSEMISWTVARPAQEFDAYVLDPRGERHPLTAAREEERLLLSFGGARIPGFYRCVYEEPRGGRSLTKLFAANIPPEESRLERLSEEDAGELRSLFGLEITRRIEESSGPERMTQAKREHWPLALAALLLLLFIELFLTRSYAGGTAPR